jgi:hypothetical protein
MPEIMDYDPSLTCSGSMATQRVRLTFGVWKYRAVIEVPVGGNCTGLDVNCNAYETLEQRGIYGSDKTYVVMKMPSLEDPGSMMECGEDDPDGPQGKDWLKAMPVSAEIISITPQ